MKKVFTTLLTCILFPLALLAQNAADANIPEKNTSTLPLPSGPSVLGVFDGRTPCQDMAKELKVTANPDCFKIKWRLILYKDPVTHAPTTYQLKGFVYRNPSREGKWSITHGTKDDPKTIVYQLESDKPGQTMYIMKGDNNILFFLDKDRQLMTGDENFAYTLNRVGE